MILGFRKIHAVGAIYRKSLIEAPHAALFFSIVISYHVRYPFCSAAPNFLVNLAKESTGRAPPHLSWHPSYPVIVCSNLNTSKGRDTVWWSDVIGSPGSIDGGFYVFVVSLGKIFLVKKD